MRACHLYRSIDDKASGAERSDDLTRELCVLSFAEIADLFSGERRLS